MSRTYTDIDIKEKVKKALQTLLECDLYLLEVHAHERSVSHRLACYLQKEFPDYNVDLEYNRMNDLKKKLKGIKECSEQRRKETVYPDIIVHKRGKKDNLLVIELKTSNLSEKSKKCDIKKLELFTSDKDFEYKLGLFIEFKCYNPLLKWFKKDHNLILGDKTS